MAQQVLELGQFEEVRDGVPLKFRVTTAPEKYTDEILQIMNTFFLPREPLCSTFKFIEHADAVNSFNDFWKKLIKEGATLIAIREGPEDERERIIGANMTCVAHKDDKDNDINTGDLFEYITNFVVDISKKVDIFETYGVDKYLSAVGLTVCSGYHGYKVGQRLLECRRPLCQALGIKVSATVFTNPISAHLAEKVGFKPLISESFQDYRYKGETPLKNVPNGYKFSVIVF